MDPALRLLQVCKLQTTSAVMVTQHVAASGKREADVQNSAIVPEEKEREMMRGYGREEVRMGLTHISHHALTLVFLPCMPIQIRFLVLL